MDQDSPGGHGIADTIPTPPVEARTAEAVRCPPDAGGRLDPESRRRIGRCLRALYAGLLAQPIPERFEALVAEFAARSGEETSR